MMRASLIALLVLAPVSLRAQVTAASSTSATSVKSTINAPLAMTPEQRHAFEASISGTMSQTPGASAFPTVQLTWQALPGASYRILRYSTLTSAPAVLVPHEAGAQYLAQVLPGYNYYFRVVALDSKAGAIDTTTSFHAYFQPLSFNNQSARSDLAVGVLRTSCSVNPPSSVALTWTPRSDVAEYAISIRSKSSNTSVANTTVSSGSYTQTGLSADMYSVRVDGLYVMHDYPTPGQTTKAVAVTFSANATTPVTAAINCQ